MRRNYLDIANDEVLDWVKWRLRIFSDKELADVLETSASTISKIRGQQMPLGATILIRILDLTGASLRELPTLIKFTKSLDS
jgi:transcriptional regulator with XRE-family HTH domain